MPDRLGKPGFEKTEISQVCTTILTWKRIKINDKVSGSNTTEIKQIAHIVVDLHITYLHEFFSVRMISLAFKGRFYNIADPRNGILKKGREVLLTGCYLRVSAGSSGCARLLPTEYFVVLLDEVAFSSSFSFFQC